MNRTTARRIGLVIGALCLAILASGVGALMAWQPQRPAAAEAKPAATASVDVGPIVERVKTTGKIAYGDAHGLSASSGTVTALAAVGSVIDRGGELFRVDDLPAFLMIGALPAWRAFAVGMEDGRDVRQLEENLAALGHFTATPNNHFDQATERAVKAWQAATGQSKSGQIAQGALMFEPAPVRVAAHTARIGAPAGGQLMTVTTGQRQISVDIDPDFAPVTVMGAPVEVTLPDGTVTTATITNVAAVVQRTEANGRTVAKIPLTLTATDTAKLGTWSDVSVSVHLRQTVVDNALRIPVTALLAAADGTSTVQKVTATGLTTVAVQLGAFGGGLVQVTGGDLAAGDVVAVAS